MTPRVSSPFRRTRDGIRVELGVPERELLRSVPDLLASVGAQEGDPASFRLDPSPYPEDPKAAAEYRRLMAGEIDGARQDDRAGFQAGLDDHAAILEDEQAEAWLRVLGEARLVLASRMGIEEDGWEERLPGNDPTVAFLYYLGWLQEELVEVLSDGLEQG